MATFYYGGQAVLEGVMMRGRERMAVAVRRPDGSLAMLEEPLNPKVFSGRLASTPFLRGALMLWEMMSLGVRAMTFSAKVAAGEEDERDDAGSMWLTVVVSIVFAVGLFFLLPLGAASLLGRWLEPAWLKNLAEGVVRLAILLVYLRLIALLPEINRLFGYHGAEHKTINAYEANAELVPEEVARYSTRHPRCGTGFLLFVALVAVVVFALLGWPVLWLRIASRIVLVPVIASITYELIRLGARYYHLAPVRVLLSPSLALQGFTTREPDLGMIATAIIALRAVLPQDVPVAEREAELV